MGEEKITITKKDFIELLSKELAEATKHFDLQKLIFTTVFVSKVIAELFGENAQA